MVQRGKCRCGKVLTFQPGPDGLKKRCARCGSVVRLKQGPSASPEDVNATAKSVPVWTYAQTEELRPVGSELESSSHVGPALASPPLAEGTGDRAILDAVADAEWVDLEAKEQAPRQRRMPRWLLVAVGAIVAAGVGILVAHFTGS
jgi:hypothetical protein